MTRRYALYFAPPEGSGLEGFGRRFLGRDHVTGEELQQPRIDRLDAEELKRITRSARHYGFHATLKAPFALKNGRTADELHEAATMFAAGRTAFEAPALQITALSRWIAFTLSGPSPSMDRLAADCVTRFEAFRQPLDRADIERRRQSGLTPRQDEQMLAYGYPYIFDDFHFHMTLAGPLESKDQPRIVEIIADQAAAIEKGPLPVDAIALYEQADREKPFVQTARFPFSGR